MNGGVRWGKVGETPTQWAISPDSGTGQDEWSEHVLLGEFRHSLDSKGRVFLPSRWREELGEVVVITQGLDRCLFLLARPRFEELAERFDRLSLENPDARAYTRTFFSKASAEPLDGQGRLTIPANLPSPAGLGKE